MWLVTYKTKPHSTLHHFFKVIANHDFLRGLLIRFFGSSRRAHLWALQERD